MSEIIKIDLNMVSIGMPNGEIIEVKRSALNFQPSVGDRVRFFGEGDDMVVTLDQMRTGQRAIPAVANGQQIVLTSREPKAINPIAYFVLAFFLGWLGVHRFYAAHIGLGFAYLIPSILFLMSGWFFWMTFFIQLIALADGIIMLTKPKDINGDVYV